MVNLHEVFPFRLVYFLSNWFNKLQWPSKPVISNVFETRRHIIQREESIKNWIMNRMSDLDFLCAPVIRKQTIYVASIKDTVT